MHLDVIFATIVMTLAALAVIGALAFVVVWEVCAIKRTLAAHKQPPSPQEATESFWHGRVVSIPQGRKWQ